MKARLQSLRLGGVEILTVRPRRSEQRRVMAIHHREAACDVLVDRKVVAHVVAGGEAVVTRARRQEAEVALDAALDPGMAGVLVVASAIGAGVVAEGQRGAGR